MYPFDFYNPTKLLFGEGKTALLGSEIKKAGVKKVLLHYGKSSIFVNGVYDQVVASLKENGIEYIELGGVKPNPVLSKVQEGIDIIKSQGIDGIVAAGGGSVIDSAKAIAAGAVYDGNVWDFFEWKARPAGALPIYTVLTISATGSEMNAGGVITKEDENKKWAFSGGEYTFPKVSVIDPVFQFTLPENQTVYGAIDAMSHIFELYFDGTPENDMMDNYSESMLKTIMKHVRVLINDPKNLESRSQLALCATLALNGTNAVGRRGGDWATHMIEHSVSAFYDIAHGAGLAILFPAWMTYNMHKSPAKFARLGKNIFGITGGSDEEIAEKMIEKLKEFYSSLGAPVTLKEAGVKKDDLPAMAENASLVGPIGKLSKLMKDDILKIYEIAYE